MRITGLLALAIFLPAFAYAALVNINTANLTTLETLPHIGPTLAQRIIDYRTQNGQFASIQDLQKVSGIGSGSNYADIAPLITVGDTSTSNTPTTSTTTASSTVTVVSTSSTGASTYVPPPSTLLLDAGTDRSAFIEVPLHLSARVTTKGGTIDSSAQVSWSFGDGSSTIGNAVDKTYRYVGTYLVMASASDGAALARDEILVTVRPARVRILNISGDGITIANDGSERLDLSGWTLSAGGNSFRVPKDTVLLPESSVLFASAITNLSVTSDATLLYPNGIIAARYAPPSVAVADTVQLSVLATSSDIVQIVKRPYGYDAMSSAKSTKIIVPVHENTAISAPTAATELAAVGAALPSTAPTSTETASTAPTPLSGFLHSPWVLTFLGIMTFAAGAFIFL